MKTVIEMAKEAGADFSELPMMDAIVFSVDDRNWNSACFERFANLIRADEREACAKAVEASKADSEDWDSNDWNQAVEFCASRIRARKDNT